MEHNTTKMHPRTVSLFALLNASINERRLAKPYELERVYASVNSVNIHRTDTLRLYSMAFVQAPRHQSGYERVLFPFSIAFALDGDRLPVAHAMPSFSLSLVVDIEQKVRAYMAVLTHLLRRELIDESTFHRSIERSLNHPAADRIRRAVEGFPKWAAHALKTSPYLDYDASEAACAELLAYVAPVSERVAA
jgi:hypothetical protein